MEALVDSLQYIGDFFGGVNTWLEEVFVQLMSWVVIWVIQAKIYMAQLAWSIAEAVLVNSNLSVLISDSWASLDSVTISYLSFFRLIDAINILLQAVVTKFSLRVMGL